VIGQFTIEFGEAWCARLIVLRLGEGRRVRNAARDLHVILTERGWQAARFYEDFWQPQEN
jgi:hypothetical protein